MAIRCKYIDNWENLSNNGLCGLFSFKINADICFRYHRTKYSTGKKKHQS